MSSHYYDGILQNFLTFVICGVILQYIYVIRTVSLHLVADKKSKIWFLEGVFLLLWKYLEVGNKEFGKHSVVELHLSSLARTKLLPSLSCLVICGKSNGGLDPFLSRQ